MSEKQEDILSVSVSEDVGSADGIPASIEEKKDPVILRYIPWKGQAARQVTEADIPRMVEEAVVLAELCHTQHGMYRGANAVSHNQISSEDPLRFFVSSSGEVIVNPVIVDHTKHPVESTEACTSFPERPPRSVKRYHVITARFQQITPDHRLSDVKEERFSGPDARVFQHEIAHLNGHSVYDDVVSPDDALGETLLTAK